MEKSEQFLDLPGAGWGDNTGKPAGDTWGLMAGPAKGAMYGECVGPWGIDGGDAGGNTLTRSFWPLTQWFGNEELKK